MELLGEEVAAVDMLIEQTDGRGVHVVEVPQVVLWDLDLLEWEPVGLVGLVELVGVSGIDDLVVELEHVILEGLGDGHAGLEVDWGLLGIKTALEELLSWSLLDWVGVVLSVIVEAEAVVVLGAVWNAVVPGDDLESVVALTVEDGLVELVLLGSVSLHLTDGGSHDDLVGINLSEVLDLVLSEFGLLLLVLSVVELHPLSVAAISLELLSSWFSWNLDQFLEFLVGKISSIFETLVVERGLVDATDAGVFGSSLLAGLEDAAVVGELLDSAGGSWVSLGVVAWNKFCCHCVFGKR